MCLAARACRAGLALALACPAAGCARPSLVVVHDLVAELPAAELSGDPSVILFGTPAAEVHQERGFSRAGPEEPGQFAWADAHVQLRLDWPKARQRTLALDVSPAAGLGRQSLDVRLNGKRVAHVRFRSRGRLLIGAPATLQKAGDNRLSLTFGRVDEEARDDERRAARLHSLSVGDGSSAILAALAEAGSPPAIESLHTDGVPSIVQMSGLELRYTLRVPPRAELRAALALEAGSQSPAQLAVAVEDAPGRGHELWSRTLRPGERVPELRGGLSSFEGRTVRLALRVAGEGPAWAVWSAPRVLAPEPPDRQVPALPAALRGANVVLVVLDAAGARHFSCYGYERATTPEIDAIAAEGVLFERAYTTAVHTLAAMSSVWTSRPPEECSTPRRGLLPLREGPSTLTERLTARGVRSAGFVASARAGHAYGMDRGFSEFHEVLTDGIGRAKALREAVEGWLQAAGPDPFFLYVHFREPHFPYDPPPPFDRRFGPTTSLPAVARRDQAWIDDVNDGRVALAAGQLEELVRLYDGNLAYADREVGALRKALETAGIWDRTVFIVTADHGEALREHGFIGHNRQVHDESARVPLVVRFPRHGGPTGVRVATMAGLLDLAPTVAEIFGVEAGALPGPGFAGTSLLALAAGAGGRGFVVTGSATGTRPTYAIRDGRFTLIRSLRHTQERLFDAIEDPHEKNDLAERVPFEAAHARARLFLWLANLRRGPAGEPGVVTLTPEQRAQVRALGYVN